MVEKTWKQLYRIREFSTVLGDAWRDKMSGRPSGIEDFLHEATYFVLCFCI